MTLLSLPGAQRIPRSSKQGGGSAVPSSSRSVRRCRDLSNLARRTPFFSMVYVAITFSICTSYAPGTELLLPPPAAQTLPPGLCHPSKATSWATYPGIISTFLNVSVRRCRWPPTCWLRIGSNYIRCYSSLLLPSGSSIKCLKLVAKAVRSPHRNPHTPPSRATGARREIWYSSPAAQVMGYEEVLGGAQGMFYLPPTANQRRLGVL